MQLLLKRLHGDKIMWMIVLALSVFSLLAVYSSTGTLAYKYQSGNTEYYLFKHFFILALGLALMYLAHLVDYRYYSKMAQLLLIVSVPLLVITYLTGTELNQAKRWITLPVINLSFQTSDLAKVALIMFLARILSRKQANIKDFKEAFLPIILPVLLVCGLIAPADLSTAVILFITCVFVMFIGRVNITHIMAMIGLAMMVLTIMVMIIMVSPSQGRLETWKSRIESFVDGDKVPYQVQQAKIAIAKGGLVGKGPGNSNQRNFLPHPYSDFIYAIIIEEYGLIGGGVIVFLYLWFLFRSIRIVARSPKAFGALLAVGLSLSIVFQAMINMAVAVNLMPVTGLTLPLVSMGGTSLFFTSISVGIILSVSRNVEETTNNKGFAKE